MLEMLLKKWTVKVLFAIPEMAKTLTTEMRAEARFLQANDQARKAIKNFLEAPDNELDGIIRSVRENGQISSKLRKRYPLFEDNPQLGERIVKVVTDAFAD